MPVFELTPTLRGRKRAFTRAQLPLLLGALFVTLEGLWAFREDATSVSALSGLGVIVVVSVLFATLPWSWWSIWSMLILAVADIVGVAFIRLAYFDNLPSVGMLAVFPVIWLAYGFPRWVISVAVAGALFITLLPLLSVGTSPSSLTEPADIAGILTLPVLITGLAIAVGEAARQLATSQRQIHQANQGLEDSLRQAHDSDLLSRTLFESVDVALAFYDTDQQLVMANTLAERAVAAAGFQLDQPPYAGPHVRRQDNKTPIPYEEQIIPRALRGDLQNHEMEWIGPPGYQVAIIARAQQVMRSDGTIWGTLIAAYDITELARSLRIKDEFITTVSHELRTPLTSILGYLELISDELSRGISQQVSASPDAERMASLGATIKSAANDSAIAASDVSVGATQVVTLDRAFLDDTLARIRRGALNLQARIQKLLDTADRRRNLQLAPTDVTVVAQRVASTMAAQAGAAQLAWRVVTTQPEWATIDAAQIEQVIENLVSNSIKYTPAPGTITVTVTGTEDHVDITVNDTGVGMTSDEVAQAFDPFWRAESARDAQVQGIGIGLGLVRDICEAHHAPISIKSAPGQGTTVSIQLPRHY